MTYFSHVLVVTTLFVAPTAVYCQQTPGATTSQPMPSRVMYRILFNEIAAFQNEAAQLAAQGKRNAFVLNYHQNQFQLNAAQAAQLIQVALPCAQDVKALDAQARAIVQAVKKQYRLSPNKAVPPLPPALAQLEAQRTAVVLAAADSLAAAFGPTEFAAFELLAQQHVGSSIRPSTTVSTGN